jgi:hypothetical protein
VYLDRSDRDRKPRFVTGEASSNTDIAAMVQKISRRVIRMLRQWGYLETGIDAVATRYDPLSSEKPELARTMAASVKQRIAFGERAGQNARRIGSGFGYEGDRPELTGPRCASVNGFSLHANTQIPAHRRDQLERLIPVYRQEAPCRLSVLQRMPTGTSCIPLQAVVRRHDWHHTVTVGTLEKLAALDVHFVSPSPACCRAEAPPYRGFCRAGLQPDSSVDWQWIYETDI